MGPGKRGEKDESFMSDLSRKIIIKKREQGFVFLQLIIATAVLGMFLIAWIYLTGSSIKRMKNEIQFMEKSIQSRSVFFQLAHQIEVSENPNDLEILSRLKDLNMKAEVENEDGKLNVNLLTEKDVVQRKQYEIFFASLLKKIGMSSVEAEILVENLRKSVPVKDLEQIQFLNEKKYLKKTDLKKYFTTYSSGQININSASRELLEAVLGDHSSSLVRKIMELRQEKKIEEISQMTDISTDLRKYFTVKGEFYKIKIIGKERADEMICSIVQRENGKIKVKQWIEK